MTQRIWAGLLALALAIGVWVSAIGERLPFVTESPGLTVNVLGDYADKPVIEVSGHKVYRDDGQLRLTTVYVTLPETRLNLFAVMKSYLSPDDAIVPFSSVYAPDSTNASDQKEGAQQMASSQNAATGAALTELGYDLPTVAEVSQVGAGTPAAKVLQPGDLILAVDGRKISTLKALPKAIQKVPDGRPATIDIKRNGKKKTVEITPVVRDGRKIIGIDIAPVVVRFPFQVRMNIDQIGGPSAGLMFTLGIYDLLTPGSLTGGDVIAGTGTMALDGAVGPIGGIAQKIAASRDANAKIFLVPSGNCRDVAEADPGDMRLVKVTNFSDAVRSVKSWESDHSASLPSCSTTAKAGSDG